MWDFSNDVLRETDSKVAPSLQAAQAELKRSQLEDSLEKALAQRPNPDELVKEGILNRTLSCSPIFSVFHPILYGRSDAVASLHITTRKHQPTRSPMLEAFCPTDTQHRGNRCLFLDMLGGVSYPASVV
jgi:hypothetical protein